MATPASIAIANINTDDIGVLRKITQLPLPISASVYQFFEDLKTHLRTDEHRFVLYVLHSMTHERFFYNNLVKLDTPSLLKLAALLLQGIKQLKAKGDSVYEDRDGLISIQNEMLSLLTTLHPDLSTAFVSVLASSRY